MTNLQVEVEGFILQPQSVVGRLRRVVTRRQPALETDALQANVTSSERRLDEPQEWSKPTHQ